MYAVLLLAVITGIGMDPSRVVAQPVERTAAARLVRSGFDELSKGNYRDAAESFSKAIGYYDEDATAHLGLGVAYYHQREDGLAERAFLRAIELNPQGSVPYQVLGEIAYRRDDMEAAVGWWTQAVERDPENAALRSRLARLQREHRAERDYNRDVTGHFLAKYEGRERIESGKVVLRILEDAYAEIGRSLSYYPDEEIQVILYSDRLFREVTEAPGWSGALFDGKIRVPIGGVDRESPRLRALLFHEYTHAAVRSITPRVPTWLNEGIAQYFEGAEITAGQRELLQRMVRSGSLPSLRQLEGSFMGMGVQQAAVAYLCSLSAVGFMEERYGMYRIRMVLDELAAGSDTADAVGTALLVSYEDVDREWRRSLE